MATITVANPGSGNDIYPNLVTAHTAASDGDILDIPAGDFYVNGRVAVTKMISLKGQGVGVTILRRNNATSDATLNAWESFFRYAMFSNKPSGIIVDGISFISKTPASGSTALDIGLDFVYAYDIIVRNCKFQYTGQAGINITHRNNKVAALIHNCNFDIPQKGNGLGYGYGVQVYGEDPPASWIQVSNYGTWNAVFVEDCIFTTPRHSIAAGTAGLYVFRYNTINNVYVNNPAESYTHGIDTHGATYNPGNYYSTKQVEIYNNTVTNTVFDDGTPIVSGQPTDRLVELGIALRGGEGVCYNNTISGFQYGIGLYPYDTLGGAPYPLPYGVGYSSGLIKGTGNTGNNSIEGRGDFYIWNNTYVSPSTMGLTGSSGAFLNYTTTPQLFVQDRDFHYSTDSSAAKPNYVAAAYPHYKRL